MADTPLLKRHPAAALFPEIQGKQFEDLVADIRDNEQVEPIVVWKGDIVDGWNRYHACLACGKAPWIEEGKFENEAEVIRYIFSRNIARRNLTAAQRADIIVQILEIRHMAATGTTSKTRTTTVSEMAQEADVGKRTMERAMRRSTGGKRKKVKEEAPRPLSVPPPEPEAEGAEQAALAEMRQANARLIAENAELRSSGSGGGDPSASAPAASDKLVVSVTPTDFPDEYFDLMPSDVFLRLAGRMIDYALENARPAAQKLADALSAAGIIAAGQEPWAEPKGPETLPPVIRDKAEAVTAMVVAGPAALADVLVAMKEAEQRDFFRILGANPLLTHARKALFVLSLYNSLGAEARAKVQRNVSASRPITSADAPLPPPASDPGTPAPPLTPTRDELYPPGSLLKDKAWGRSRGNGKSNGASPAADDDFSLDQKKFLKDTTGREGF